MPKPLLCIALVAALTSCVIDDKLPPRVDVDVQAATAEVRRGMVQTQSGVVIPGTVIGLPTKEDGTILIVTEGSLELSDDTGDAWRPDGQSGRFARVDWSLLYEQVLDNVLLTFGMVTYTLPNGLEFPFGERGSTTEMLFEVGTEVWGVVPSLRFHYDVDEVEGLYMVLGVGKELQFKKDWSLALDLGLGWMDGNQADWNYAQVPPSSGLADLRATARLGYAFGPHTSTALELGYSEVMDSDYRDWFDLLEIDPGQGWLGIGMHWSY